MRLSRYVFHFPLKNGKEYLLYNSATCTDICISKNDFSRIQKDGRVPCRRTQSLLQRGLFLVGKDDNEAIYCQETLHKRKYRGKDLDIAILVTDSCNLCCSYCYKQNLREDTCMSMSTAEAFLKWYESVLFLNSYKKVRINFHGGEPLLNVNLIKWIGQRVVAISKKNNTRVISCLFTNGTLLSSDLVNDLYKEVHLREIHVSMDGPRDIHNKSRFFKDSRKGTFDDIYNNVLDVLENTKCYVVASVVLLPRIYKKQLEILKDLKRFCSAGDQGQFVGVRFSGLTPILANDQSEICVEKMQSPKWLGRVTKEVISKAQSEKVPLAFIGGHMVSTHCSAMSNSFYLVDPTGVLYKCHNFVGLKEYSVGNVREGINILKDHELMGSRSGLFISSFEECEKCKYAFLCNGGCRAKSYALDGDYDGIDCKKDFYESSLSDLIKTFFKDKYQFA